MRNKFYTDAQLYNISVEACERYHLGLYTYAIYRNALRNMRAINTSVVRPIKKDFFNK